MSQHSSIVEIVPNGADSKSYKYLIFVLDATVPKFGTTFLVVAARKSVLILAMRQQCALLQLSTASCPWPWRCVKVVL